MSHHHSPPPMRLSSTTLSFMTKQSSIMSPSSPLKSTAPSLTYSSSEERDDEPEEPPRRRRASTKLISQNAQDMEKLIGSPGTQLLEKCCGGGCCMALRPTDGLTYEKVAIPDNEAYKALQLKFTDVPTTMSNLAELPPQTVSLLPIKKESLKITPSSPDSAIAIKEEHGNVSNTNIKSEITNAGEEDFTPSHPIPHIDTRIHPPSFVKPHPPYDVYSAKIFGVRELTKPGAEKRTYHFDLDVTNYPIESGVDFRVGGAIGIMAPNDERMVEELMDLLAIPKFVRDKPVLLKTTGGRWPTVWGEEQPRELVTTRRDLLTWCADIQSYPPTKPLLRLFAKYNSSPDETKILNYLASAEGQNAFCDLRTGPFITIVQLLNAFPHSQPPLGHLLSALQQLMPRFYSLSADPVESCVINSHACSRVAEIAVSVHETENWTGPARTGVGSGYFERQAKKWLAVESAHGTNAARDLNLRIPMFKGLMANPLAREFVTDGPMLLIGAGVGVAPFRGFVQRRLKTANCANKVWVLQGVRDSLLDELYSGEWGVHEDEVKKVVQSRRGTGRYVQEEVRAQADLVWEIIK